MQNTLTSIPAESTRPALRWKELLAMGAIAIVLRFALSLLVMRAAHAGFAAYAASSDGAHYMALAHAYLGDFAPLRAHPEYNAERLFPGYPAFMAGLHVLHVPWSLAAILPSWLAVAPVAIFSALYVRDRRIGWAMAVLTPSYILNASLISTEAMCLLLGLIGLLAARRGYPVLAGIAFGVGGLFRPVIVFALLGWLLVLVMDRRWRSAVMTLAAAGAMVSGGLLAQQLKFGDLLMSFHRYQGEAYGGELFTLPFKSLIVTTLHHPPLWKIGFVWAHVLLVLAGCILAIKQTRSASAMPEVRALDVLCAVWLCVNTLYVLCIGSNFGFDEFPRFIVPALPPLFWAYRAILPRRAAIWLALGVLSLGLAFPPAYRRLKNELSPASPATTLSAAAPIVPIELTS